MGDPSEDFNLEMLLENNDSQDPDSDPDFFQTQPAYTQLSQNESDLGTVYNRKEKSLGELCRRFLYYYGIEGNGVLYLD